LTRFAYDLAVGGAVLAALLLAAAHSLAGWGPAGCAAVRSAPSYPVVITPASYPPVTIQKPTKVDTKACPCSPACVCGCNQGHPCRCKVTVTPAKAAPKASPAPERKPAQDWRTSGVQRSPDEAQAPSYRRNGRPCTREEARRAVQGAITDDSAWLRVTAVGLPDAVKADWATSPLLAEARTKALFQAYKSDDPIIAGLGFRPGLYVQSPDGKVLHRQDDYRGAAALAQAIRKADPSYDPAKDPDLNKPPVPPPSPALPALPFNLTPTHLGLLLLGGAVVYLLWSRK
jgi:hypothetical protein